MTQSNNNEDQVYLLPEGSTNEQYNSNMAYFEKNMPTLFKKLTSLKLNNYQICLNTDESLNVFNIKTQSTLYPLKQADQHNFFTSLVDSLQITLKAYTGYTKFETPNTERTKNLPLNTNLHNTLLESNNKFKEFLTDKNFKSFKRDSINFLPLLRVYGVGLGNQILMALQKFDVAILVIHEPDIELFNTSLFSIPWDVILSTFDNDPNRHCLLNIEQPLDSIDEEIKFLLPHHPFFYNAKATLFGTPWINYQPTIELETNFDLSNCLRRAAGCYEDQMQGLISSIDNIQQRSKVYSGKGHVKANSVFVVGSGPSLDESIQYIKAHQNEVIIIACGSALSALIKNDIIPDIHVLQERFYTNELLLQYASEDVLSKLIYVKLNAVDSKADKLYKNVLTLQKANDPGSTLLPVGDYPWLYNVVPTVTNTGMVTAKLLNPDEIYLFGLDFGSSQQFSKKHAVDTLVLENDDVKNSLHYKISGNFGKTVSSNEFFIESRNIAEMEIAQFPHIKWINIGDGAIIKGSQLLKSNELPTKLKVISDKEKVLSDFTNNFDINYSIESIKNLLTDIHIPTSQDYLLSLLELFDQVPKNRLEFMSLLSNISKAIQIGENEPSYLPHKLFSLEFANFMNHTYTQLAAAESDDEAIQVYQTATDIFKQHIESVFQDFLVKNQEFIAQFN